MPSIDGIASGLDTTGLINAITGVTGALKQPISAQLSQYQERKQTISEFSGKLTELAKKLGELSDRDTLFPIEARLSSESQFSVSTSSVDIEGAFDVQVHALAYNASFKSAGFADKNALGAIGEGTFSVTYGGVQTDITLDGTNSSLQGLADALDAVDGIRAYVVDTGEASNPYRLVVNGQDSGAAHALTFDASGLTGGSAVDPGMTALRQATDAHITLNGMDVYSASNNVSSAVPGVTFELLATGDAPVRLDLARDTEGLRTKLDEFVASYNEVMSFYEKQTVFNADAGLRGGLVGEAEARRIVGELSTMVGAAYANDGALEALSQLGIKTNTDGTLSIDDDAFEAAVTDHYDDTVSLLTADGGPLATIQRRIEDLYVDEDSGLLSNREETIQGRITDLQERIDRIDERVGREEERLRKQFAAMEAAMSQLNSTSAYLTAILPQTSLIGSSSS